MIMLSVYNFMNNCSNSARSITRIRVIQARSRSIRKHELANYSNEACERQKFQPRSNSLHARTDLQNSLRKLIDSWHHRPTARRVPFVASHTTFPQLLQQSTFARQITKTFTTSNHVVEPNARDYGDAPRVHQGWHSVHQPLHVRLDLSPFFPPLPSSSILPISSSMSRFH